MSLIGVTIFPCTHHTRILGFFPMHPVFSFFPHQMAQTHPTLLQQWRDRAITGQIEARRVIAEMLTPSGGSRANCYKFVCSVTGVSVSTIGKVMEQMKKTGKIVKVLNLFLI